MNLGGLDLVLNAAKEAFDQWGRKGRAFSERETYYAGFVAGYLKSTEDSNGITPEES